MIPISTATNKPGKAITVTVNPMSSIPSEIAITPNGKTAYVVVEGVVGAGSLGLVPIQTATNKPGKAIYVGLFPGPHRDHPEREDGLCHQPVGRDSD